MTTVGRARPGRALAVGAHPDDVEFGAGATLATWSAAGTAVHLLVLTDGSKGSWDGAEDVAALIATREAEARAAAAALGAASITFLGRVDGELADDVETRAAICAEIRRVRPDVVLGHDPWKRYRLHPDHRHAGFLTIDAIVAARDPHYFPDQADGPHRPAAALLFEADAIDHHEAVTPAAVDAKVAALLEHRSQWRSTMGFGPGDTRGRDAFAGTISGEVATTGGAIGLPLAEGFARIDDL